MLNFCGGNYFCERAQMALKAAKVSAHKSTAQISPTSFAHHQVNQVLMMPQ